MATKKRTRRWLKILLWLIVLLIIVSAGFFTIGYFYYGRLIKNYISETVQKESKGIYRAEIGEIFLDLLNGNLNIRKLTLIPDLDKYRRISLTDTLPPILIDLKLEKLKVKDFGIKSFISDKTINIRTIEVGSPVVIVHRMKAPEHAKEKKSGDEMLDIDLPKGITGLTIKEILLKDGKLTYNDHTFDTLKSFIIPSCDIIVSGIKIGPGENKKQIFNAEDINVVVRGIEFKTKNQLNLLAFGEIGISTGKQVIYVKKFHLKPLFDRKTYAKKMVYQSDRMDITVDEIRLSSIDLRSMILHGSLIAGKLSIDNLVFDGYRDKRIPRKPGFKPPMPQDGIRKLKSYLKIDSVIINGGKTTYSEQVGDEPGSIFFDKLKGSLTGLTNDSNLLKAGLVSRLKGTAWLMGKGRLDATIDFRFGDKSNKFSFSAKMGSLDLREINPMLSKLVPGHVESGILRQMVIPKVQANDNEAYGSLLLYYSDLNIKMDKQKDGAWEKIKTGVINFVANDIVVNNNNPTSSGKMKTGVIHFVRHKDKGIVNYLWKSAFSGIKSTVGINDKQQKQIKKANKNASKK